MGSSQTSKHLNPKQKDKQTMNTQNKAIAKGAAETGLATLRPEDMPTAALRRRWYNEYRKAQDSALKMVAAVNSVTDSRTVAGKTYPDQYLHVEECRSGETWIVPFDDQTPMDLDALVDAWIASEFCGELQRDGKLMPRLEGDYYAQILTDNRAPDSAVCWTSGGFFLKLVNP